MIQHRRKKFGSHNSAPKSNFVFLGPTLNIVSS